MESAIKVKHRGRYKAIIHRGDGVPVRESAWSKNLILNGGFNAMLVNNTVSVWMVAGAGSTSVLPTDGLLASYLGKANTNVSQVTVLNSTPDGEGYVTMQTTYRYQFAPGSLGGGNVNVSEAGMAMSSNQSAVNSSTALLSRGLLVDDMGDPTTVSVNNDEEYLEILWEHTAYFEAETTGIVNLTIDGVPTDHTVTVRPANFVRPQNIGWPNPGANIVFGMAGISFGGSNNQQTQSALYAGALGALTAFPSGYPGVSGRPTSVTMNSYVADSFERTFKMTWSTTLGNVGGGASAIVVQTNSFAYNAFQLGISPKLMKTDEKQLDLQFSYSLANKT